jgi:hypothetical protein
MGIDVHLENESGKRLDSILDPKGMVARLLPIDDDRFPLLRHVDLYGDTIFNRSQCRQVLCELELLEKSEKHQPDIVACLNQLKKLARKCDAEPHLYLKFMGD